ncbi:MAG: ribosome silencing factor [Candidatus Omnitrophica bacterium]|nr:ribosome silencing factor [Candidatus Omnitrophota bacterium]
MPRAITPRGRALESQAKALVVARAALEKQAEEVVVMDLRPLSSITDFFVIGTAGSARQLGALKDHIEAVLLQHGHAVWQTEGSPSAAEPAQPMNPPLQWLLMDCGDVVVHLFDQYSRTLYRLEDLWADAPRLRLPAN